MAEIVKMPLMSDTMTEGVIVEWHKEIGDEVEAGELLAEIETDKATMEFEAPEDGFLLYKAEKNKAIPVNALLAVIGEKGEDVNALIAAAQSEADAEAEVQEEKAAETKAVASPAVSVQEETTKAIGSVPVTTKVVQNVLTDGGRIKASPLAKSMARENNIDISLVSGTGDDGRIIKRDIEAYLKQRGTGTQVSGAATNGQAANIPIYVPAGEESFEDIRVSQMRKTIARRLAESKFNAPHFYLTVSINMDNVMTARKQLNEIAPVKISFNDIIVKAAAMALRQHPAVNSSWLGDTIRKNHHIHIGVAVAVEEGLLVPVLRFADNKSLSQLATETRALAEKAKTKKLQPDEMQGNTFTISNLGMFGIEEFTAIINPPDACIMAVGGISPVPSVVNGEIKVVNKMKVTMSCDHRVVDGATGAKFLQTFKAYLENPLGMLV